MSLRKVRASGGAAAESTPSAVGGGGGSLPPSDPAGRGRSPRRATTASSGRPTASARTSAPWATNRQRKNVRTLWFEDAEELIEYVSERAVSWRWRPGCEPKDGPADHDHGTTGPEADL